MILHPILTTASPGRVRTTSRVEWSVPREGAPETLWFEFPAEYADKLSSTHDGFLVSLLPVAMVAREPIIVRGLVSQELLYALGEYQRILHFWKPDVYTIVDIRAERVTPATPGDGGSLLPFSGGVDSFYTLWSHLPERQTSPAFRISHAVFIRGWDIDEDDYEAYENISRVYEPLFDELGIAFVRAATNVQAFRTGLDPDHSYNTVIIGTLLQLSSVASRIYLSEDNTPDYAPPSGMNRLTTHLLGTEHVRVVNVGGTVSRLEKLRALASWPATYERLRPCWKKPTNGVYNCCQLDRCSKCGMTMTALDMLGALDRYKTFPKPINRSLLRKVRYEPKHFFFPRKWIQFSHETGRKDYVFDHRYIIVMSILTHLPRLVVNRIRTYPNPRAVMYRLSDVLKRRLPVYARGIALLKQTRERETL